MKPLVTIQSCCVFCHQPISAAWVAGYKEKFYNHRNVQLVHGSWRAELLSLNKGRDNIYNDGNS